MTIKEHLAKMHEDAVAHHEAAAKHHRTLGKLFKAEGGVESAADIAAAHIGLAKCHDDAAESHSEMLKAISVADLSKAAGDQVVTDKVSGIITHFPAYPRSGAPPLNKGAENVPPEFRHLVEVDEG